MDLRGVCVSGVRRKRLGGGVDAWFFIEKALKWASEIWFSDQFLILSFNLGQVMLRVK